MAVTDPAVTPIPPGAIVTVEIPVASWYATVAPEKLIAVRPVPRLVVTDPAVTPIPEITSVKFAPLP